VVTAILSATAMCIYYYVHHHHFHPCNRAIDIVVHYIFCAAATMDAATGDHQPCQDQSYDPVQSVDYNNPCASGGCLASPDCIAGLCRLDQLNRLWICCRCNRGGNVFRFCSHRMRGAPDTFCYHICCGECQPDQRKQE